MLSMNDSPSGVLYWAQRLLMVLLGLTAGCQAVSVSVEHSPYYLPPLGSVLVLHQPLTIPAGRASIYLQGGRVRPFRDIDVYYPNCKFELRTLSDIERTIEPDRFIITRAFQEVHVRNTWNHQVVANITMAGNWSFAHADGGPSPQPYATEFRLLSADQPDVLRLTCMHWEDPFDARFLTLAEIRAALGDVITLELTPLKPGRLEN